VIKDRSVSQVGCYSAVPGARLDSLFTFTAVPIGNHKNDEIQRVIKEEIALLIKEGPSESELQVVKNKNEARLIYSLESNNGLASMLAFYQSLTGDWRYLYHLKDRIQAMQAADIQRVAKTYFIEGREVSAFLEEKNEE
jgi:predicted Zn-dependent peptidase